MSKGAKRKLSAAEKRALFEALLQEEGVSLTPAKKTIPRRDNDANIPLSFAQQRLWFLDQLTPHTHAYNFPTAMRITGVVDIPALQCTLTEIATRHEALRTTFRVEGGRPFQVIMPPTPIPLPIVDLQSFSDDQQEAEVWQQAMQEAQLPFDLAQGSLFRALLIRLSETNHVLVVTMHHIISDGWSVGILIQEMAALYLAFATGKEPTLPELPVQYPDYCIWQHNWLQGEEFEKQQAYWHTQLQQAQTSLELPTDHPHPPTQTYRGQVHLVRFADELLAALHQLSRQEGASLFMTLLSAFAVLLYRYTQQTDILIGTPVANRNRRELEGLIGFFVNTIVLRADLTKNPSFRDLLRRIRQMTLDAYAHQDMPFEMLVEALQPQRHLSQNPLFQVMFAFQNVPMESMELPGLVWEQFTLESGSAKFDLTLSMWENQNGLGAAFEYNSDLFDLSTIKRMVAHFEMLLTSLTTSPDNRINQLPILPAAEAHQLLVSWNQSQTIYSRDILLPTLIERVAQKHPDALAVVHGDKQVTYAQLNQQANQLAHYLHRYGVNEEVIVGIYLNRSIETIVALLATWKAGGAYLPLILVILWNVLPLC